MTRTHAGFTLTELVVVLVLLGVLAAYIAPRFSGRDGFSELTVQQDLIQSIRFAQQLAMSRTDRAISLVTTANRIDVRDNGTSVNGYPKTIPPDVTLSNANLVFDRLGAAGNAATVVSVTGRAQSYNVTVEAATGYAH